MKRERFPVAQSCFVEKLEHYLPLTDYEKESLAVLEDNPADIPAGQAIFEEGHPCGALFVLRQGRVFSASMVQGGERQILKLYYPGDIVGTANVTFVDATASAVAAIDSVVCRFPRSALKQIFITHPRLAALFYAIGMLENVALADRLKSIGRTDGKARIAALLLDIFARARITDRAMGNSMELKLTQTDIGDAVGLTQIHVNRLLREMTEQGFIARDGRIVTLLDEQGMAAHCDFINRHARIDTSWFPEPAQR
ncbi:Crp/Fnr family transcriptional regulator [Sphingomonas sp. SCN 67-18]|uniref:Crp/Fnr family transcriptional regulator n=1 Tax=uncultured Sphingomonas sp. TaxID=158754 RepID=UPI0025D0CB02|nr:Crp/Fnr family transcriptional regulator [Sphingomonas sp. SCN 67-18]